MDNEQTLEVPLPEGVEPSPDLTDTQELPVVPKPFPEVQLVTPVKVDLPGMVKTIKVETLPKRLLGDPILTMPAPVADETPLYDQIHGKPERPKVKVRRKMHTGDKVLAGMGAAALVLSVGVYGMVTEGWGAGDFPEDQNAASAPHKPVQSPEPTVEHTERPKEREARPEPTVKAPVRMAAAPETYVPKPERSITVVKPTPTPQETEKTQEPAPTTSSAPEPTSAPPRPSHSSAPTPTPTRSTPTPTLSTSAPTPSLSLSSPPVTQSVTAEATPTEVTPSA